MRGRLQAPERADKRWEDPDNFGGIVLTEPPVWKADRQQKPDPPEIRYIVRVSSFICLRRLLSTSDPGAKRLRNESFLAIGPAG